MQAKALWHLSPTQSTVKEEELAVPDTGNILLQSVFSLISNGTERIVASGLVPKELQAHMGVPYMGGSFEFPIKYGYSLVAQGKALEGGEPSFFHVMHPHQDQLVVSSAAIQEIPTTIPPKRAVLTSNVETAVNAVWDSGVSIGDKVMVVGFGLIGSLVARVLSLLPAVDVVVAETNTYRSQLAQQMGFTIYSDAQEFDIAYNTSANAEGLQLGVEAVGNAGKVVELSWYGTKLTPIHLGGSFHYGRKQIISSQVSQIPVERTLRWDYARRKQVVFKLLENPIFDEHLTHEIAFEETPNFFEKLRNGQLTDGLSWVVKY